MLRPGVDEQLLQVDLDPVLDLGQATYALTAQLDQRRPLLPLAVQPLDELVVGLPALAAQQLVQPAVAEPAPLGGKGAETLAQAYERRGFVPAKR